MVCRQILAANAEYVEGQCTHNTAPCHIQSELVLADADFNTAPYLLQTRSGLVTPDVNIIIITVPGRAQNQARFKRLTENLNRLGLNYTSVHGPNMERYCPSNVRNQEQSRDSGCKLLQAEWQGRLSNCNGSKLQLFQVATLVGHMRAWKEVSSGSAVILEDDASVESAAELNSNLEETKASGARVAFLEKRHCWNSGQQDRVDFYAAGLAGYWLDSVAASALLDNFELDVPVDCGMNRLISANLRAMCPQSFAVSEYGGEVAARHESARVNGCASTSSPHPVASFLHALIRRTRQPHHQ